MNKKQIHQKLQAEDQKPELTTDNEQLTPTSTSVRKIKFSATVLDKSLLIASHSHSKEMLTGKIKPDDLISLVVNDAINYYFEHKIIPEIQRKQK